MNERLSPKRQAAELAFAKISVQRPIRTRAQVEDEISTAEREGKTARLRAQRMAREIFDIGTDPRNHIA